LIYGAIFLTQILFVCLGNICRSPSAEAVMQALIGKKGLADKIKVDSAGVIGWHAGEPADRRMQMHAIKRDYNLTSISRQFRQSDFEKYDYIIGMDYENIRDIKAMDFENKYSDKIFLMTSFCHNNSAEIVPDPYYGGKDGFEKVLDILEDACQGLLGQINSNF
jgi:protein-tyrosine phosphatase